MEKFNERLRQLREETGVSMNQLAKAIDVSNAAVCKWENGIAEPKVTYLIKLSEFFECTVDYLVGKTDDFGTAKPTEISPPLKLNNKEKQLIETYRQLNPRLKTLFEETIKAWTNVNKPIE